MYSSPQPYFLQYLPQSRVRQYIREAAKNPLSRLMPNVGLTVGGVPLKDAIKALENLLL